MVRGVWGDEGMGHSMQERLSGLVHNMAVPVVVIVSQKKLAKSLSARNSVAGSNEQ